MEEWLAPQDDAVFAPAPTSPEDVLIARYFKPLATHPGARGLVDDAAVLAASDEDLVITTDAIVEGVHFLSDDPPDTVARKALRVNLSDLAAKGAVPAGFVLTLALRDVRDDFLAPFARALGEDATLFDCPLLGGDTVSTAGPLMMSVTAFGRVPKDRAVHRIGAKPGDRLFVSGSIGDAAFGLDVLMGRLAACDDFIARYRVPQPRVALAVAVREHASAAMDVSDGLVGDLTKFCAASQVSARIDVARVPLSPAAHVLLQSGASKLTRALTGGDDYEILCAVPQDKIVSFQQAAQAAEMPVFDIGSVEAGSQAPTFLLADGRQMIFETRSFSHF